MLFPLALLYGVLDNVSASLATENVDAKDEIESDNDEAFLLRTSCLIEFVPKSAQSFGTNSSNLYLRYIDTSLDIV